MPALAKKNTTKKIIDKLKPSGPINIQLFLTSDNTLKVFEINPRFSTTSIMSYEGGVNEIEFFIEMYDKTTDKAFVRPKTGVNLRRTWKNNFYE